LEYTVPYLAYGVQSNTVGLEAERRTSDPKATILREVLRTKKPTIREPVFQESLRREARGQSTQYSIGSCVMTTDELDYGVIVENNETDVKMGVNGFKSKIDVTERRLSTLGLEGWNTHGTPTEP